MKINSKKAELLMVSVSLVWGSSYLLMKIGLDSISPFNLIALRFGIAFICMALIFGYIGAALIFSGVVISKITKIKVIPRKEVSLDQLLY